MGTDSQGLGPGGGGDFAELTELVKDLTVDEIEREIAQAEEGSEREALKARIRDAELAAGDPRQGVLAATDPQPVTPPPGPDEPAAHDLSGRPDLTEVAEGRAANRNVRVLDAQEG